MARVYDASLVDYYLLALMSLCPPRGLLCVGSLCEKLVLCVNEIKKDSMLSCVSITVHDETVPYYYMFVAYENGA